MMKQLQENRGRISDTELLAHFDGVIKTGAESYICKCPAHQDKRPSLAIKLGEKRLVKCFAGCSTEEVLTAVGLTFSDLMPEHISHHVPSDKKPFPIYDAFKCIASDALVVLVAARMVIGGEKLKESDVDRLSKAVGVLQSALTYVGVRHV